MQLTKLFAPALTAALLVGGCQSPFGSSPASQSAQGRAELHLLTDIQAGGFRPMTAEVSPYTPGDVVLLELSLFKRDGNSEVAAKDAHGTPLVLEVPKASLGENIRFTKLHPNTTYRVQAKAYSDVGKSDLISLEASSSTLISITQDERPTIARIKVQLKDKTFGAEGETGLDIASGSLVPAGSESITTSPKQPD